LDDVKKTVKGIDDGLEKGGSSMLTFLGKAAGFAGLTVLFENLAGFIKQFGSEAIEAAGKNSDALADMSKATNLAGQDLNRLNEQLKQLDTRTTQELLQAITVVGGQLGVANAKILGFTKSVGQAVVALGDEFSGGAEEVAGKLGVLQKLFKETSQLTAGDSIRKVGSAINELGADGSATGPVISDFAARIGQLGDLAPQITQTLGLGVAFQEMGLSAEISAGGITNILLTASKDTAGFAKQVGLTEAEFKKLINTNPNEVLLKLAGSLQGMSNTNVAKTLDNLGIKSQEATKVLSLLANQTQTVRDKQALAANAFAEGTSLTEEFNKKNNNLAATMAKSAKVIQNLKVEVGDVLAPAFLKVLQTMGFFIDVLKAMPKFISDNRGLMIALAAAIVGFNAQLIISNALALKDVAIKQLQGLWTARAAIGQRALNLVMSANPIGLVITLIGLLVGAFIQLYDNSQTVRAGLSGMFNAAVKIFENLRDAVVGYLGGIGKLLIGVFTLDTDKIKAGLEKAFQGGKKFYTGLGEGVGDAFNKGFDDKVKSEKAVKKVEPPKSTDQKLKLHVADPSWEDPDVLLEADRKKAEKLEKQRQKQADKDAKAQKKVNDDRLKAEADAAQRLEDLEVENIEDEGLRKQAAAALAAEREINQVNASKATAEQKAQLLVAIDKRPMQELAGIDQEYNAKKLKEQETQAKKELELANKSAIAKADLSILLAGKNEQKLFDARVAKIEALRDIELQNELLTKDEKMIIQRKAEAEIDALREENHQKEKERRREIGEAVVNLAQGGLQAITDFDNISTSKEIAQAEQVKSTKIKKLDQELKSKKITQDQYNAAKALAEQEADQKTTALKRKQAETDKKVALGQAFIATALAVTKALPNIPLSIIAGILGGLNIAKIAATPVLAKGSLFQRIGSGIRKLANGGAGFFKNAGVPQGPSHAQGGIDLINNVTGERLAEMEGNEPIMVLSRNTYANNRPVVDSLLDSSLHRNGAKIKLASGGVVNDGGSSKPAGSVGLEPGADETVALLRDIREALYQYPTLLQAVVSLTDLDQQVRLRDALKNDANLSGKNAA
jgi:TP901 family phage tail tape measure protein